MDLFIYNFAPDKFWRRKYRPIFGYLVLTRMESIIPGSSEQ
jgi:hypothetical protein